MTNDARLRFESVTGLTYEYRIGGASAWRAILDPASFRPDGLVDGPVRVEIRAVDTFGNAGPAASLTFVLDTAVPAVPVGLLRVGSTSVGWSPSIATDVNSQEVRLSNSGYTETRTFGSSVALATLERWRIGTNRVEVTAIDLAGNRSASLAADFTYLASGVWGGQDGSDFAGLTTVLRPDGKQDVRLDITGLPYGTSVVGVNVSAFGGGEWAWPSAIGRQFAARWIASPGTLSGRIYFQTNRRETGRPFFVSLRFADGTSTSFWMNGGTADPNLPASGGTGTRTVRSASAGGGTANTADRKNRVATGAAARAARQKALSLPSANLARKLMTKGK